MFDIARDDSRLALAGEILHKQILWTKHCSESTNRAYESFWQLGFDKSGEDKRITHRRDLVKSQFDAAYSRERTAFKPLYNALADLIMVLKSIAPAVVRSGCEWPTKVSCFDRHDAMVAGHNYVLSVHLAASAFTALGTLYSRHKDSLHFWLSGCTETYRLPEKLPADKLTMEILLERDLDETLGQFNRLGKEAIALVGQMPTLEMIDETWHYDLSVVAVAAVLRGDKNPRYLHHMQDYGVIEKAQKVLSDASSLWQISTRDFTACGNDYTETTFSAPETLYLLGRR